MLAAEELAVLVVVLDREAQHPAGPFPPVAFLQQRLERRHVVYIAPLRQEQVRVQEGDKHHDDRHQAERVHHHIGGHQEPHDIADNQDHLDGRQADDFVGAQLMPVAEDGNDAENGIAASAVIQDPVQGPLVEPFPDPEQPVGQRCRQGDEHAGDIHDRRKHMKPGAQQHPGVQHADREDKKHERADKRKNKEQQVKDPEHRRRVFGPGLIQPEGDTLKQLCADVDNQYGKERAV